MAGTETMGRVLALPGTQADCLGWAIAVLSWSGYRVDRAESGKTALKMLESAYYDVLLLGYDSSSDDIQLCVDMVQDPEARLPTVLVLTHLEAMVPPPQMHFVPCGFLEPGFTSAELLQLVEKLRLYRH